MVAIDGPSNVDLGVKTTLTSLWSLLFSKKKIPFQLLIKGIRSFSPENEVKRIILFPFFFFGKLLHSRRFDDVETPLTKTQMPPASATADPPPPLLSPTEAEADVALQEALDSER